MIDNECFQSPTESGPGDLRSGRGRLAGVMAPHASAEFAFIASESDEQSSWAVPEGLVSQFPGHGVARHAMSAASAAPLIVGRRGAQEHCFSIGDVLARAVQAECDEVAERSEVRSGERKMVHVEVFRMVCVGTSSFEGPRPNSV